MENKDKKLIEGVQASGYPLEFQVSRACQRHGWSTINSKYYVDDVQGTARELDIVAYKIGLIEDVQVCTAILISCKMNRHDSWTLIAKDKNTKDPNTKWYPLHGWANDPVLRYVLSKTKWEEGYIKGARPHDFFKKLMDSRHHIFAYQLVNTKSGKKQDTKNIFDSVSSLMKAQWYEIDTREKAENEKRKRLMKFNLLSVADADLELCKLSESEQGEVEYRIEEVDHDTYIASYIIDKQQVSSRINFVRFDALDQILTWFDEMHDYNVEFFAGRFGNYYANPFESAKSTSVFLNQFSKRVVHRINSIIRHAGEDSIEPEHIEIYRRRGSKVITIGLPIWEDDAISALNNDEKLADQTRKAFLELYRYGGRFKFDVDIPF